MSTTPSGPLDHQTNLRTPANKAETPFTRFVDLWWIQIPGKLRSYSRTLWAVWSDGIYLTAWPRLATILVFAIFAVGFIEGGTHWSILSLNGYGLARGFHSASFAQMLPLMVLAVVLGSLSANLGFMLVIGFALGDFFWSGVPFSPWERSLSLPPSLYGRIPQLAAYLVFFFLAAWPITANKFLVGAAHRRFRESELWKTVLMVVVQALFIYEWTYFAPMGVKQQWDCCMQTSPLDVRYFHQVTLPWLLAAAVVGVVARRVLIYLAEKRDPNVIALLNAVCDPAWASISRMPGWLHAIVGAIIITLLFLGFAVSLPRVIMTFAVVLALMLFRTSVLSGTSLWRIWTTRLAHYPAVIRLGLATAATYLVSRLVLTIPGWSAIERSARGNFAPELVSVLVGLCMLLVLLPNGTLSLEEAELASDSRPLHVPIPSPVIQAGIIISLILLASKRALAADCEAGHCCYGGNNGLAGSSAAGSATSASSAAGSSTAPGSNGSSPPASEPWWKKLAKRIAPKSISLPGGWHVGTDKPSVGWGGDAHLGPNVDVHGGVDVSPTAGNDPKGPIIDINAGAKVQVHGQTEGPAVEVGANDHITAGINTNNPGVDGTSPHFNDQLNDPAMNQNNEGN